MSSKNLLSRMNYFAKEYNFLLKNKDKSFPNSIKWSRDLKNKFEQKKELNFDSSLVRDSFHRPFVKQKWYSEKMLNDVLTKNHLEYYGKSLVLQNPTIGIVIEPQIPFVTLSVNCVCNMHIGGRQTQMFPLNRFDENDNQIDNITDWGLNQFTKHYGKRGISKESIFHYIYAVLHNPVYRKKSK